MGLTSTMRTGTLNIMGNPTLFNAKNEGKKKATNYIEWYVGMILLIKSYFSIK